MAASPSESERVHDLFASLEAKVQASARAQRAAEKERDAAIADKIAYKAGLDALPSDLFDLKKVAMLTLPEGASYTVFCTGFAPGTIDRRHLCSAVAVDSIPGDTGGIISSLGEELIFQLTSHGGSRPLYVALRPAEWVSLKTWWGGSRPDNEKGE
jgi:hypothetical protein